MNGKNKPMTAQKETKQPLRHWAILAIDPSIVSLGIAGLIHREGLNDYLVSDSVVIPEKTRKLPYGLRISMMLGQVRRQATIYEGMLSTPFTHIIIERPRQWGAVKSVASQQSGDMEKLYLFVGALLSMFQNMYGWANVYIPYVTEHKGQLPKHVTQKRMETQWCRSFPTDDEADAVWIASWANRQLEKGLLPEKQRQVVTLVDLAELTYSEVSEALEIPIGTVMSRLCRARQALRDRLVDFNQTQENTETRLRRVK